MIRFASLIVFIACLEYIQDIERDFSYNLFLRVRLIFLRRHVRDAPQNNATDMATMPHIKASFCAIIRERYIIATRIKTRISLKCKNYSLCLNRKISSAN